MNTVPSDLEVVVGSCPGTQRKVFFSSEQAKQMVLDNTRRVREVLEKLGKSDDSNSNVVCQVDRTDSSLVAEDMQSTDEQNNVQYKEHVSNPDENNMEDEYDVDGILRALAETNEDEDEDDEDNIRAIHDDDNDDDLEYQANDSSDDDDDIDITKMLPMRFDPVLQQSVLDVSRFSSPLLFKACVSRMEDAQAFDEHVLPMRRKRVSQPNELVRIHCASCDRAFIVAENSKSDFEPNFVCQQCSVDAMFRTVRLPSHQVNSLEAVIDAIHRSSNIIVVSGAGISVSTGIPDFRSENGLYQIMKGKTQGRNGVKLDGSDLFDLDFFKSDPSPFFQFLWAMEDVVAACRPTPMHHFLLALEKHNKLRRIYTQNIDGLEFVTGISQDKVVMCHGGSERSTCTSCRWELPTEALKSFFVSRRIPYCDEVREYILKHPYEGVTVPETPCVEQMRKRALQLLQQRDEMLESQNLAPEHWSLIARNPAMQEHLGLPIPMSVMRDSIDQYVMQERGILKPNIVFFGEQLPDSMTHYLMQDLPAVDLVLVMGTSLQVAPVSSLPARLSRDAPMVLINFDSISPPGAISFDMELIGNADAVATYLADRLGWTLQD